MATFSSTEPDPPARSDGELEILLAVYASVTAEMNRRHGERYQFHTLSFVLLGGIAALLGVDPRYVPEEVKAWVFAVAPLAFTTIIGLMLKEHQYINMRDRYLETELRPRLEEIGAISGRFSWLGWEEFEHLQMGRKKGLPRATERLLVFLFLDILDYAIPGLLVVTSLVAYLTLRDAIGLGRHWADAIAAAASVFFMVVLGLLIWLRTVEQRWYPSRSSRSY